MYAWPALPLSRSILQSPRFRAGAAAQRVVQRERIGGQQRDHFRDPVDLSVRHAGGTCIAALRPHAVQSVAQGGVYRFEWAGGPEPAITLVSEELPKTSRH